MHAGPQARRPRAIPCSRGRAGVLAATWRPSRRGPRIRRRRSARRRRFRRARTAHPDLARNSMPEGSRAASLALEGTVGDRDDTGVELFGLGRKKLERSGRPERARRLKRSGAERSTSRVWVPIEPVDPTTATRRSDRRGRRRAAAWAGTGRVSWCPSSHVGQANEEVGRRQHKEQGVDAVEHPTVSGQEGPHVLHAEIALDHRLDKVATRCHHRDDEAQDEGSAEVPGMDLARDACRGPDRDRATSDETLPGLVAGSPTEQDGVARSGCRTRSHRCRNRRRR